MPASTIASIRLAASVVLRTYIVKKRNQVTSSASRAIPERNAQANNDTKRERGGRRVAEIPFDRSGRPEGRPATDGSRRAEGRRPTETVANIANPAATRFNTAAVHAAPATPNRSTRISSAATTPTTAPSVFQPYKRPSATPNRSAPADSAPTTTGNVAPMAVAGTMSTRKAATRRIALTADTLSDASRVSGRRTTAKCGRRNVTASPAIATSVSSRA